MEAADLAGDDRTFEANFTGAGAKQLLERMREKLREFKDGEESLADYVMVLLTGRKRKDEASKDLNIFLGADDSATFISWLWDHLSLNLHLYVQTQEKREVENKGDEPKELQGRHKSLEVHSRSKDQIHNEHTSESNTTTRSWNKREWKGTGREGSKNFPLRSVLTDILHGEEKKLQKSIEIRQPPLSNQRNGRKRDREDEPQQTKRELPSRPVLGASRRLLQFAVRDAVKAVQQTSSSTEPSSKRLRSVVSTLSTDNLHGQKSERTTDSLRDRRSERSTENVHDRRSERSKDSVHDRRSERSTDNSNGKRSERTRQILQVPGAALKAAAEAAADSSKGRSTGSVFSRLGQGNAAKQPSRSREERRDFEPVTSVDDHDSDQHDNDEEISGDLNIEDEEDEMNVDTTSDDDVDIDDGTTRYQGSDSHAAAVSSVVEKKFTSTKCSAEPESNTTRHSSLTNKGQPLSSSPIRGSKTVAGPVNLSSVEPPSFATPKDVHVVEKLDITPMNPNVTSPAVNVKESGNGEVQKESHRSATSVTSSYSSVHPTEDADSRTLYVSNVHFAATKDSLSRHFNKFGAVLKVVIVTNAATGQPTGSAYVEFLHTESAERALSLNGTSFMTRILKVVRRSSHEAAHFYGWPGSGRSSMYARHSRMAYPRGALPGNSFRGRTPMKAGARSFQWKREASGADSNAVAKTDMSVSLPSAEQVLPPAT
ncbi:nucleolin-like [Lolium rigidum]|uniref:nucleolin-like n=1 Tax=Lolium rigidum TaxID=89674 RepID=UPI001F5D515F|nr:nucleolin-like [Lolium rigidum]